MQHIDPMEEQTMPPELIDHWTKLTRSALDAVKELTDLNTKLLERTSEQQFEFASASLDAGAKGVQLVSEPRSYRDFISGQTAIVTEYGDRVQKIVRRGNEIAAEARDEYAAWFEGKVREAARSSGPVGSPTAGKKVA
jgi:Phasin protein